MMHEQLKDPKFWDKLGFDPFSFHALRPEVEAGHEGWGFRHREAKNVGVAVSPSNVQIVSIGQPAGLLEAGEFENPWKVMISNSAAPMLVRLIVLGFYVEQATE